MESADISINNYLAPSGFMVMSWICEQIPSWNIIELTFQKGHSCVGRFQSAYGYRPSSMNLQVQKVSFEQKAFESLICLLLETTLIQGVSKETLLKIVNSLEK